VEVPRTLVSVETVEKASTDLAVAVAVVELLEGLAAMADLD
jgi:hypothetical protein